MSAEQTDIATDQDTYVDEASPTSNYGSVTTITVKNTTGGSAECYIILHFNLGAAPSTNAVLTGLGLRLYVSTLAATPNTSVRIFRASRDTFDEDDPSWSNLNQAEGIGWDASPGDPITDRDYGWGTNGRIAFWTPTTTGWDEITLDNLLDIDSLDWEDDIIFVIKFESAHDDNVVTIHSKENTNDPVLRAYYTDANPAIPTGLSVSTVDSTELLVEWTDPADDDLNNVEVWRATSKYGSYSKQDDTAAGTQKYSDDGLVAQGDLHDYDPEQDTYPNGRTYWYKLRAEDDNNNFSDYTEPVSGTTRKPIQPIKVTNITPIYESSKHKIQFDFDWALETTPEADFQKIEIRYEEESGTDPTVISTLDATLVDYNKSSHKMDKASSGCVVFTTYRFLAIAYDNGGLRRYNSDEFYDQQLPEGTTLSPPTVAVVPISPVSMDSGTIVDFDMRQSIDPDSGTPIVDIDCKTPPDEDIWYPVTTSLPTVENDSWKFTNADNAHRFQTPTKNMKFGQYNPAYLIHFKLKFIDWVAGSYLNIIVHADTDVDGLLDDYYAMRIDRNSDDSVTIQTIIRRNGVTQAGDSYQTAVGQDELFHDYWVKIVDGRVRIYEDDLFTVRADFTDTESTKLYSGYFIIFKGNPDNSWFKDFQIYGALKDIDPSMEQGLRIAFGDNEDSGWTSTEVVGHVYNCKPDSASDNYNYLVDATDGDDLDSARVPTQTLTINNVDPVSYLIVQVTAIKDTEMTAYGHLSFDQEGVIATSGYEFDFGEGGGWETTSNSFKTHTYTTTGVKTVKLRVKDEAGNYSAEDSQQLTVYDSGSTGVLLTLLSALHNIKETPVGSLSRQEYPELDYDGIQSMGSGNLELRLTGEHHDPDESNSDATRETNMKNERDAWKDADEKGYLVRYVFPQYGTLTGYLKDYRAELDERDYYRLPFTVTFIVVSEEQIAEP